MSIRLALAALLLLGPSVAWSQPQDSLQQRCITSMNAAAAAVSKAQARSSIACLMGALRGRLPAGQTAQSCLTADTRGKIGKARLRLAQTQSLYCASLPDFGFNDAAQVGEAVSDQGIETYARLFGPNLNAAILLASADGPRARCQAAVAKTLAKMQQLQFKAFLNCKAEGLRTTDISSATGLEECVEAIDAQAFRVVGKLAVKLVNAMDGTCPGLNIASAFPGQCSGATDFVDCVRHLALCEVCLSSNRTDDVDVYCDAIDDGTANASCVDVNRCGNGVREPGEGCDDGNQVGGDCCAPGCSTEATGGPCAADSNGCTDDHCNASGVCVHAANAAGCDDALFCNGSDQCSAGSCSMHSGNPCASGAECNNQCNAGAQNCFTDADTPCTDDGSECTQDRCDGAGLCGHPPLAEGSACSSDDKVCTQDVCDALGACAHRPIEAGTVCADDSNPCTTDLCDVEGNCVHALVAAGTACGDPQATSCSAADTCDGAGICRSNDSPSGAACDNDGNGCTDDRCDGGGQCTHANNTAPCNDGAFCNGADTCAGGSCSVHVGDPCGGPDGDGNCSESCNEVADNCTGADANGSACSDNVFCNGLDSCSGGSCSTHPGNPCPGPDGDGNCSELCNEAADACSSPEPNGTACNDGFFCNGTDTCSAGACSVHTGNPCPGADGDNNCSETCNEPVDSCSAADANGSACNDGIFCNGLDTCSDGACQIHAGDPCPGPDGDGDCTEQCNESSDDCSAADPNGAPCQDGQGCNGTDFCSGGTCAGLGTCCGTVDFTFTINSSSGGAFNGAEWPGGTTSQSSQTGCDVTIRRPSGRIDLVGTTGDNFGVTGFTGFQNCVGTGGQDGDGCQPVSCPFAGIGSCEAARPSCSVALNGSGSSRYFVRCTDP